MKITFKIGELILVLLLALSVLGNTILVYKWKTEVIELKTELYEKEMVIWAQQDMVYQSLKR